MRSAQDSAAGAGGGSGEEIKNPSGQVRPEGLCEAGQVQRLTTSDPAPFPFIVYVLGAKYVKS